MRDVIGAIPTERTARQGLPSDRTLTDERIERVRRIVREEALA